MQGKDGWLAKFMPHFDGPYEILRVHPETLSYTLCLPPFLKAFPMFHVSQLCKHIPNNNKLFLEWACQAPKPLVTTDGTTEYFIEKIMDHCPHERGYQYLVCWTGYGPEHDLWLPKSELIDMEALAKWEAHNQ